MSDEYLRDERLITAGQPIAQAAAKAAVKTLPGGLNQDTVVKLLLAWTITPFFAGIVAALAYFILSHIFGA